MLNAKLVMALAVYNLIFFLILPLYINKLSFDEAFIEGYVSDVQCSDGGKSRFLSLTIDGVNYERAVAGYYCSTMMEIYDNEWVVVGYAKNIKSFNYITSASVNGEWLIDSDDYAVYDLILPGIILIMGNLWIYRVWKVKFSTGGSD